MTNKCAISGSALSKKYDDKKGIFQNKHNSFWAIADVSFTLMQGETLAILGEAGSGKSTLAKVLAGIEQPTSGMLMINNQDVSSDSDKNQVRRKRAIRMVFQDTLGSLNPSLTLGEILTEPLINLTQLDKMEQINRVLEVVHLVGLKEEYLHRLPHTFSAGERQRIAIARALILDPVCIVADEPLSALETSVQSQIVNLMLRLQKELKLSYIIISHNIDVIKHMSDKTMVLSHGRVVEYGPTDKILNSPQHPYTHSLLQGRQAPLNKDGLDLDANADYCVYCYRCPESTDTCRSVKPQETVVDERLLSCHKFTDQQM